MSSRSYYTDAEWAEEQAALAALDERRVSMTELVQIKRDHGVVARQRMIRGQKAPWRLRKQQRRDALRRLLALGLRA